MKHKTVAMEFRRGQTEARVGITSCWHVGNPMCKERAIGRMIARFSADRMPWWNLGDTIEAIVPLDKRFHADSHKGSVLQQMARAATLAEPAKATFLGAFVGNHEDKLAQVIGNVTVDLVRRLYDDEQDVIARYLSGSAFLHLQCPGGAVTVFSMHSRLSVGGGGTSDPERDDLNRIIRLRRRLANWQADVKIVGHGHRLLVGGPVSQDRLVSAVSREVMVPTTVKPEWVAMCPSMFASYDSQDNDPLASPSYAELSGYPPTDIGHLELVLTRSGKVARIEPFLVR